MKSLAALSAALLAGAALFASARASAQERTVKITGFGAKSGVVRVFGINSEAAMKAAAEEINKAGGVTLGDGSKAKFAIEFLDDRCNAEEGISVVRRIASSDAFVAVGPTCSNVAESLFGILQKKVGDASDSGLQFPIIADVAAKGGLAKISEWAFRNVPSEFEMYKSLFAWLKTQHPDLKTIYGGVEKDFAHSNATYGVMKARPRPTATRWSAPPNGCSTTPPSPPRCARCGAPIPTSWRSRRIRSRPAACSRRWSARA